MDIQLAKCGTLVLMCNHQPATILTIWPHTHVAPPAANRPFQLAGSTCSSLYSNTSGRLRLTFRLSNRHAKTARWHWFALRKGCGRALALTFSRLPGTPALAAGSLPPVGRFHAADLGPAKAFLRPTRLPPYPRQALAQPKV